MCSRRLLALYRSLFDICRRHGLELEEKPEYGGRDYLEKQDYILMKLKQEIAEKEKVMDSLVSAVEDMDQAMADVAEAAYNHAVDVVTETATGEGSPFCETDADEPGSKGTWKRKNPGGGEKTAPGKTETGAGSVISTRTPQDWGLYRIRTCREKQEKQ